MKTLFSIILIILGLQQLSVAQYNDWLIKFNPASSYDKSQFSLELVSPHLSLYRFISDKKLSTSEVNKMFPSSIEFAFPNLEIERRNTQPDDFFYIDQWNLQVINAEMAWDQTTGGQDVNGHDIVVAILDDGYDVLHEDLEENYWTNTGEIAGDNIDNDNNGYIDDVKGVNIQTGTGNHFGVKHGTQVAGITAAKGYNSIGIAGVGWNNKLLIISGVSNIAEIIKSMEYLYDLKKKFIDTNGAEGANIVVNNFSGGLKRLFPSDFPSWCEVYDLLGEVGILSVGAVANENYNVELEGDMPTLCDSEYLIMVTNTNVSDQKALDAAFGSVSVDLGAPGENIISTSIGNDYETISGTSASAPHVAGAVGLLHSLPCTTLTDLTLSNPQQSALVVKAAILNGVDNVTSLDKTVSKGRLNIFNSMLELREICGAPENGELSLAVTPNFVPRQYSESIKLTYKTEILGPHSARIFDTNGRLVFDNSFSPPVFENGERFIDLRPLNLSPGIYIVQLSNESAQTSQLLQIY